MAIPWAWTPRRDGVEYDQDHDEGTLAWLQDGLPTLFQTVDPQAQAETDARIHAMGLKTWADLEAEFGGTV